MLLEKYFDLTLPGTDEDIRKYLANGWYEHYRGITLCILRFRKDENDDDNDDSDM